MRVAPLLGSLVLAGLGCLNQIAQLSPLTDAGLDDADAGSKADSGPLDAGLFDAGLLDAGLLDGGGARGCVPEPGTNLEGIATYMPSTGYYTIVSGDLNQDGMLDLVVGYFSGPGMEVFFGRPDGGLSAPLSYAGFDGSALAIGDLNGDGFPDVVASDAEPVDGGLQYGLNVFLNDGDGGFRPPILHPTGASIMGVGIGDVNGDGIPDVAVGEYYNGAELFLGRGTGELAEPIGIPGGWGFLEGIVLVLDLNRDGLADIVIPTADSYSVLILLSHGDGGFDSQSFNLDTTYPGGGGGIVSIPSESGAPDLAVGGPSNITILKNSGTGQFTVGPIYNGAGFWVTIGDFNGDCLPDLAASTAPQGNVSVSEVSVLYGDGAGGYSQPISFAPGPSELCGIVSLGMVQDPRAIAIAVDAYEQSGGVLVLGDASKH